MSQKALLVINAQVGLVEVVFSGREKAAVIGTLVGQARSANVPVLFVQHDSDEGILQVGYRGWQLHSEIGYSGPSIRKWTPIEGILYGDYDSKKFLFCTKVIMTFLYTRLLHPYFLP